MKPRQRSYKIHLAVPRFALPRENPTLYNTTLGKLTTRNREEVTCSICNHFLKAYCDDHVIERGNVFKAGKNLHAGKRQCPICCGPRPTPPVKPFQGMTSAAEVTPDAKYDCTEARRLIRQLMARLGVYVPR
jgi:hypothetical protein